MSPRKPPDDNLNNKSEHSCKSTAASTMSIPQPTFPLSKCLSATFHGTVLCIGLPVITASAIVYSCTICCSYPRSTVREYKPQIVADTQTRMAARIASRSTNVVQQQPSMQEGMGTKFMSGLKVVEGKGKDSRVKFTTITEVIEEDWDTTEAGGAIQMMDASTSISPSANATKAVNE